MVGWLTFAVTFEQCILQLEIRESIQGSILYSIGLNVFCCILYLFKSNTKDF